MAETAPKKDSSPSPASNDSTLGSSSSTKATYKEIIATQSQELVIALCGPIGSGIRGVNTQLERVLKDEGYVVHQVRVSNKLTELYGKDSTSKPIDELNKANRYSSLMDVGDKLRHDRGLDIGATLAIHEIALIRFADAASQPEVEKHQDTGLIKRAYIIDQLKHPSEVKLLKETYRGIFYLVGVLCDEERREISLTSEGMDRKRAQELISRDKKDNINHGQQLEKTLSDADFFINNSDPNSSTVSALFSRFFKLLHGGRGVTPTKHEIGMYSAYSSSMQSACLSRQVGAAIVDAEGNLLATGRNDVPKFGGGLYSEDDNTFPNSADYRCVHREQRCQNDKHKHLLKDKVHEVLSSALKGVSVEETKEIVEKIYNETPMKSLIEYSRAIHAEMDALISLVRKGKAINAGAILYTTTYPCHSCARHIIAAGISKVVYIEPYEKSLALKLHDDALCNSGNSNKVQLVPFQGISPKRYQVFFSNTSPKKDNLGHIILTDRDDQRHVDKEFVSSYLEKEAKVAEKLLAELE
ncbi:MAG: anti-phage dCTP deaminase [Colwellia sp.]|jgi:Deoxycytidylate deaminase